MSHIINSNLSNFFVVAPNTYLVVSDRPWNATIADRLSRRGAGEFHLVTERSNFTSAHLSMLCPEAIFVVHWSHHIPKEIYNNYNVVIFHMTDLPYGRGGSPLQNLVIRGHTSTILSAIRCVEEMDAGEIFLKKPLSLDGSALDIFMRADEIIEEMIVEIIRTKPKPKQQTGPVVNFKRRNPHDSEIPKHLTAQQLYDFIRMLDAPGYPAAQITFDSIKIELRNCRLMDGRYIADAVIIDPYST